MLCSVHRIFIGGSSSHGVQQPLFACLERAPAIMLQRQHSNCCTQDTLVLTFFFPFKTAGRRLSFAVDFFFTLSILPTDGSSFAVDYQPVELMYSRTTQQLQHFAHFLNNSVDLYCASRELSRSILFFTLSFAVCFQAQLFQLFLSNLTLSQVARHLGIHILVAQCTQDSYDAIYTGSVVSSHNRIILLWQQPSCRFAEASLCYLRARSR